MDRHRVQHSFRVYADPDSRPVNPVRICGMCSGLHNESSCPRYAYLEAEGLRPERPFDQRTYALRLAGAVILAHEDDFPEDPDLRHSPSLGSGS